MTGYIFIYIYIYIGYILSTASSLLFSKHHGVSPQISMCLKQEGLEVMVSPSEREREGYSDGIGCFFCTGESHTTMVLCFVQMIPFGNQGSDRNCLLGPKMEPS